MSSNTGRSKFRSFAILAFVISGCVLAPVAIGRLKAAAKMIVYDTMPGLTFAGEAIACQGKALTRTLILLAGNSGHGRVDEDPELAENDRQTALALESYRRAIYQTEDEARFKTVIQRRENYLVIRTKVLKSAAAGKSKRTGIASNELLREYDKYKEAMDQLFDFNVRTGATRGQSATRICIITQWLVACALVALFAGGFLLGVRGGDLGTIKEFC